MLNQSYGDVMLATVQGAARTVEPLLLVELG
jgi:hypothetical protein